MQLLLKVRNSIKRRNQKKCNFQDLKERLKKEGLVSNLIIFDIGAHRGKFSLKLLTIFPWSKIYSFEPSSNSFQDLKKASTMHPEITAFQYALGETERTSTINLNQFDETNSLFTARKTNSYIDALTRTFSTEEIIIKTLDSLCCELSIKAIDILKIDVQGSELNVLKGAKYLLSNQAIHFIYCEVEFLEIYQDQPLIEDIIKYLRVFQYTPIGFYNINYSHEGYLAWCDILFKKN